MFLTTQHAAYIQPWDFSSSSFQETIHNPRREGYHCSAPIECQIVLSHLNSCLQANCLESLPPSFCSSSSSFSSSSFSFNFFNLLPPALPPPLWFLQFLHFLISCLLSGFLINVPRWLPCHPGWSLGFLSVLLQSVPGLCDSSDFPCPPTYVCPQYTLPSKLSCS